MAIVFGNLLLALPTSVFVCVSPGLNLLQGSSLVLVALVSGPAVVTSAVLLAQSVTATQRPGWLSVPGQLASRGAPDNTSSHDRLPRT